MTSLDFAEAARTIAGEARRAGCIAPSFRSPPRVEKCRRSIQIRADGSSTVAVEIKARPFGAVLSDMIEGAVVANELGGSEAADLRELLWVSTAHLLESREPLAEVTAIRAA